VSDRLLILTCNCLTIGLLKSSTPVYVPSVTRYPPSTPSVLRLFSRSFNLVCRSFSVLRASRSCFVSRGRSGAGAASRSLPRLRNDRSARLPRPLRPVYTCVVTRSEDGGGGTGPGGGRTAVACELEGWPSPPCLDEESLEELFPMLTARDCFT